MATLILDAEFVVDLDGSLKPSPVVIEDGVIKSIGEEVRDGTRVALKNHVVMPGFVNCHSHAFQRLLRGRLETKSLGTDNFWTWRENMYAIVQKITKDDLALIARFVYLEMLEAGFTNVAEFHYLHHEDPVNAASPIGMSRALAESATQVGMNLTLLPCAYQRYDFKRGLCEEQRRFGYFDINDFLAMVRHTRDELCSPSVDVGVAIHSVRAAFESSLGAVGLFAKVHDMPLHVHVSEQIGEVEDCIKAHARSPISLLNESQVLSPRTTLVHAIHLIKDDIDLIASNNALVCVCPSTEKNLGDGIPSLSDLTEQGVALCIGSDQHVRIDPFSEARSLEELERLRLRRRNILGKDDHHLYENLLPCLTSHGLRSINQQGTNATLIGRAANLVGLLLPPEYEWYGPKVALDAMMLTARPSDVSTVITRGQIVVQHGTHNSREKSFLVDEIKKICRKFNSRNG